MAQKAKRQPRQLGLYSAANEHDACGVGMVVNIHGGKSHELVDNALKVLENMEHRGAETRDKTGDGAGILIQIPHEFILLQGIPVPEKGRYGTGLVFLPKDKVEQDKILKVMIEVIEAEGLNLMKLRDVPTNPACLGKVALESEPDIKQVFITGVSNEDAPNLEKIARIDKRARIGILTSSLSADYMTVARGIQANGNYVFFDISIGVDVTSWLSQMSTYDIGLEYWTIDDADVLAELPDAYSGITSNSMIAEDVLFNNVMSE